MSYVVLVLCNNEVHFIQKFLTLTEAENVAIEKAKSTSNTSIHVYQSYIEIP